MSAPPPSPVWKKVIRALLPGPVRRIVRPPVGQVGKVCFGDLRRLEPFSRQFGYDRGTPVDRYYIESFLRERSASIQGRVLEIGDDAYTRRFGGSRVTRSDVLHIDPDHPGATIIADLADAPQIPSGVFDCIICTQTLQLIYNVQAATATIRRILKPTGTALVTLPGISPIPGDRWGGNCYWSFTALSSTKLFQAEFSSVQVLQYGNVLTAVSFLEGLALEELRPEELDVRDPQFPVILGVEARP